MEDPTKPAVTLTPKAAEMILTFRAEQKNPGMMRVRRLAQKGRARHNDSGTRESAAQETVKERRTI